MASRSWLITSFALDDFVLPQPGDETALRYGIVQREVCPDTERPHYQGYLEFTRPVRFAHVKRICEDNAMHCETRKGTRDDARNYCRKEETRAPGFEPQEVGTWESGGTGCRNDLNAVKDRLDKGDSELMIAQEFFTPWVKYHRAFNRYKTLIVPRRDWEMDIQVYYGTTGTGKTRKAFTDDPNLYMVPHTNAGVVWFDHYQGEHTMLLDDFYGWLPWSFLLQLLDRYNMQLPVKGSLVQMVSKKIVITSNKHPTEWYDSTKFDPAPLLRRITRITHFNTPLSTGFGTH